MKHIWRVEVHLPFTNSHAQAVEKRNKLARQMGTPVSTPSQ